MKTRSRLKLNVGLGEPFWFYVYIFQVNVNQLKTSRVDDVIIASYLTCHLTGFYIELFADEIIIVSACTYLRWVSINRGDGDACKSGAIIFTNSHCKDVFFICFQREGVERELRVSDVGIVNNQIPDRIRVKRPTCTIIGVLSYAKRII